MSGSATSPFRGLMSRGCKVHFMLGPPTCLPLAGLSTLEGLLTHHSDAKVSLTIRCLLHGASALTVTGLPPASSIQHDSLRLLRANLQDVTWGHCSGSSLSGRNKIAIGTPWLRSRGHVRYIGNCSTMPSSDAMESAVRTSLVEPTARCTSRRCKDQAAVAA